ncbi:MAG: hypothetical protein IPI67_24120 [Myxococcales bacterium]|nr:hypothetical protein [Myxococcales bacterium]
MNRLQTMEAGKLLPPSEALARAARAGAVSPIGLELRASPAGQFWLVRTKQHSVRLCAESGEPAEVTRQEAEATARRDQPGSPAVRDAQRLETKSVEFRGKPLPAWRVEMDDEAHTFV